MMLEFKVKSQHLILTSTDKMVVADSQDYLKMHFDFTEDWNDVIKIALFVRGETRIRRTLDEHDVVAVPYQVLEGEGNFEVSVFGNNQENADNKVITSSVVTIPVKRSGLLNGETFDESEAGLEGGILHQITQKAADAEAAAARAEALAQQFDEIVNAPHYKFDNEGHLIFVYGREVG